MLSYDYIIIGAGVSGCCTAYELSKHNENILIIDKLPDVALGASGAAGAFLSPLLGKPNDFKELVTKSLNYASLFYQENFPQHFNNCGTTRIPQNNEDKEKFKSYIPFMDFPYEEENDGYFFKIGSVVDSNSICKSMLKNCKDNVETKFNYEVSKISHKNETWILNDEIYTKNIIFTTGSDITLIDQFYLKLRAVWGRRIDITTSTTFTHNYHKACSISQSKITEDNKQFVSIGATHHRIEEGVNDITSNTDELLKKAKERKELENVNVINHYVGARACSVDYFPIVGDIIDSKKTLEEFPYLINGTNVDPTRFTRFKNAYVLTGVGGRGFVLAPYLANVLVNNIIDSKEIDKNIKIDRLFKREVKRIK